MAMMATIPNLFSRQVKKAAKSSRAIVIGMAAMVNPNSTLFLSVATTKNWMVNPRKKKKSNFSRAM